MRPARPHEHEHRRLRRIGLQDAILRGVRLAHADAVEEARADRDALVLERLVVLLGLLRIDIVDVDEERALGAGRLRRLLLAHPGRDLLGDARDVTPADLESRLRGDARLAAGNARGAAAASAGVDALRDGEQDGDRETEDQERAHAIYSFSRWT